jgi:hypothetical protein
MKKYLFLMLVLASSVARAGDIDYASNQAGGLIVLTDETSPNCPQVWEVYYTTDANAGNRQYGCWFLQKPWVWAKDSTGKLHQYPMTNFQDTDYATKKYTNGGN